jgi:hypothetical protein
MIEGSAVQPAGAPRIGGSSGRQGKPGRIGLHKSALRKRIA